MCSLTRTVSSIQVVEELILSSSLICSYLQKWAQYDGHYLIRMCRGFRELNY
jgi:hypothetical protein